MADIQNNSVRLIHFGGVMAIPGQVAVVPNSYLTHTRVVAMLANGDLEDVTTRQQDQDEKETEPKPEQQPAPPPSSAQTSPSKPPQNVPPSKPGASVTVTRT